MKSSVRPQDMWNTLPISLQQPSLLHCIANFKKDVREYLAFTEK